MTFEKENNNYHYKMLLVALGFVIFIPFMMKKTIFLFVLVIPMCVTDFYGQKFEKSLHEEFPLQKSEITPLYKNKSVLLDNGVVKTSPNPFAEYVTISFVLQNRTHIQLLVFDQNGQMVAQIRNSEADKGNYNLQWNGTNHTGAQVKNGSYQIQLIAGDIQNTSNVTLKRGVIDKK